MERLYRSRTERIFTGLAAALARALGVRPGLVRVVFVVLALASGLGLVLYGVGSLLVPAEGTRADRYGAVLRENFRSAVAELGAAWRTGGEWLRAWEVRRIYGSRSVRLQSVAGAALVVLGLLWFLGSLGLFGWLTFGRFLALALVGAGLAVLASPPR